VGGGYQSYVIICNSRTPPYYVYVTASSRNLYEINNDMVKVGNHPRVDCTSMLYIYKVFVHLQLWGAVMRM
jgi:hypothetical protein